MTWRTWVVVGMVACGGRAPDAVEPAVPGAAEPASDATPEPVPEVPTAGEERQAAGDEEPATEVRPPRRIADPSPPSPPSPPPPSEAPAPLTEAPDALFACERNGDCVVACDFPGGCCNDLCGCKTAVNRRVLARLRTRPWAPCTERCPAVGCVRDDALGAVCTEGRCRAMDRPF